MRTKPTTSNAVQFLTGLFVAPEPTGEAEPCRRCGCAVAWRTPSGCMACRECNPPPKGATLFLVVNEPAGPCWHDYDVEFASRLHRLAGLPEPANDSSLSDWAVGEDWTETTPTCPKCKSAATWTDANDALHCLQCDPPRRARKLLSAKAIIESTIKGRLSEAAAARQMANELRHFTG